MMLRNVKWRFNKIILFRKSNLWIRRSETTSSVKSKLEEQWEKKIKFFIKTYEDAFGIPKQLEMHDRVIEVKKNLNILQAERRRLQIDLFKVQQKLNIRNRNLSNFSERDEKYQTMVAEVSSLSMEQDIISALFRYYYINEMAHEAMLALAIQEKQHNTVYEKHKMVAIITGIVIGVLGTVFSYILSTSNRLDFSNFPEIIELQTVCIKDIMTCLRSIDKKVTSLETLIESSTYNVPVNYLGHLSSAG